MCFPPTFQEWSQVWWQFQCRKWNPKKEADVSEERESCVWRWFLLPKPEEWSTYESIDLNYTWNFIPPTFRVYVQGSWQFQSRKWTQQKGKIEGRGWAREKRRRPERRIASLVHFPKPEGEPMIFLNKQRWPTSIWISYVCIAKVAISLFSGECDKLKSFTSIQRRVQENGTSLARAFSNCRLLSLCFLFA